MYNSKSQCYLRKSHSYGGSYIIDIILYIWCYTSVNSFKVSIPSSLISIFRLFHYFSSFYCVSVISSKPFYVSLLIFGQLTLCRCHFLSEPYGRSFPIIAGSKLREYRSMIKERPAVPIEEFLVWLFTFIKSYQSRVDRNSTILYFRRFLPPLHNESWSLVSAAAIDEKSFMKECWIQNIIIAALH